MGVVGPLRSLRALTPTALPFPLQLLAGRHGNAALHTTPLLLILQSKPQPEPQP